MFRNFKLYGVGFRENQMTHLLKQRGFYDNSCNALLLPPSIILAIVILKDVFV